MRMKIKWVQAVAALTTLAGFALLSACDISSSGSATRNVPVIVEGFYARADNSAIVSRTSGAPVRSLNLRQSGDQLEAIDNNGIVFRGTIGQVIEGARATFTMEGRSTSGNRATMAGNFNVSGNVSTMTGSWIEDMLVGQLFATAIVPTNAAPDTATPVSVSPATANVQVNQTVTFTASGGRGSFTWTRSNNSLADISVSGDRNEIVRLTGRVAGTLELTARDSGATPASGAATISITAIDVDNGEFAGGGTNTGGGTDVADGGNNIQLPPTPGQS